MDLFGTAGIRGDVRTAVTPDLALQVGRAVGTDAAERDVSTVVVGRDGRATGPGLVAAVEAGALSAGVDVTRVGVVPTPALASASRGRAGVMVSASHNPAPDNGLKLFADGVEFDAAAERRVESLVGETGATPVEWRAWGSATRREIIEGYRDRVVQYARSHGRSADGVRVAVDCGTGTAALATPQVLTSLGAAVTAVNATVDGHFPARPSKPTPETLAGFRRFIAAADVDLGIGHDGDADRIVVVDGEGSVVHEDTIVAILAEHYVRTSGTPAPVVVTTPNASVRIDDRVAAVGGRTTRVPLGGLHEGIAAAREAEEVVAFAAEPWKHLHPALGGWIDGVASAAVLTRLVAEAGGLGPLREPVDEPPYRKVAIPCPDDEKSRVMGTLETALPERFPDAAVDLAYGVRLDHPDGSWLLVRPSGTEPVIRLYAEGEAIEDLVQMARETVETAIEDGAPDWPTG